MLHQSAMNVWQIRLQKENFKRSPLKKTHQVDVINSWSFYHFFVREYFSKRGWRNSGWKGTQNKIFYDSKAIIINLYGRTQIVQSEGNDWRGAILAVIEIVHRGGEGEKGVGKKYQEKCWWKEKAITINWSGVTTGEENGDRNAKLRHTPCQLLLW